MVRAGMAICLCLAVALVSGGCESLPATPPVASAMPTGNPQMDKPPGFVSFCLRFQDQCPEVPGSSSQIALTDGTWIVLNAINLQVNRSIRPLDDMQHFGRPEYWTIPDDGYGNCHDYALTKRKMLAEAGLPLLALRIAIVSTPYNGRHAILTVATDKGDYVLDNLTDDIRSWDQTGYDWIMRQGDKSTWQWVSLQQAPPAVLADNRH